MVLFNENITKKDRQFIQIAKSIALWSKCGSRKIGSVLVKENRIIATGYNGASTKVNLCQNNKCRRKEAGYKSGEGLELCPAVHSEVNTILQCALLGISSKDSTLYCYCGFPCSNCLKEIINAGITRIVCLNSGFYDKLAKEILDNYKGNLEISYFKKVN